MIKEESTKASVPKDFLGHRAHHSWRRNLVGFRLRSDFTCRLLGLTGFALGAISLSSSNISTIQGDSYLYLIGNRDGALSPCGCTAVQSGGVSQEVAVLKRELAARRANHEEVEIVDLGRNGIEAGTLRALDLATASLRITRFSTTEAEFRSGHSKQKLRDPGMEAVTIGQTQNPLGVFIGARTLGLKSHGLGSRLLFVSQVDGSVGLAGSGDLVLSSGSTLHLSNTKPLTIPQPARGQIVQVRIERERPTKVSVAVLSTLSTGEKDAEAEAIVREHDAALQAEILARTLSKPDDARDTASALTCKECHPRAYSTWRESNHRIAVQTLVAKNRLDFACLKCHDSTYAPAHPDHALGEGVQCTSCHGDGSKHVRSRRKEDILNLKDGQACLKCHDQPNSPGFDYAKYLEKIRH
jgi:hypothetical protein